MQRFGTGDLYMCCAPLDADGERRDEADCPGAIGVPSRNGLILYGACKGAGNSLAFSGRMYV